MTAIVKTNEKVTGNYAVNNSYIFIARKSSATGLVINWTNYYSIPWGKYTIKESDFRSKTATFSTPQYLDLTTGQYCILIISNLHEGFGGTIINVEYDYNTGLYNYQCQDFSRAYQGKVDLVSTKATMHRVLQYLITQGGVPLKGNVSKQKKIYKKVLSGLLSKYKYAQKAFGSILDFNPMTEKKNIIIRNKSWIEAIRTLVYGSGAYIDVYFNKYGQIQIEPYHKDDFLNTGLLLTANELSEVTHKFDTTNIITGVTIHNADKKKQGTFYSSESLINLDLTAFFGNLSTSIDSSTSNTSTSTSASSSKTGKKSTNKTKDNGNPYGTKKKVWLNSDNINGRSSDMQFMKDVAKILKKNGWKTKIVGIGPNTHTENYMGPKNGIWFCIYGGADSAVFRETVTNNSYTNKLKRLGSRTVIGMHGGGDIRKGGKYYKYLPRAHDDNYSPSSFHGISHPLQVLTKGKVPIMYASNASKMAAKFLAGGDNPEAC